MAAVSLMEPSLDHTMLFTEPLPPIEAHVTAGRAMVWNADDAKNLREEHGVIGSFVGSLPEFRQQNLVRGLPLLLSVEETRVCLAKGCLSLTRIESASNLPLQVREVHLSDPARNLISSQLVDQGHESQHGTSPRGATCVETEVRKEEESELKCRLAKQLKSTFLNAGGNVGGSHITVLNKTFAKRSSSSGQGLIEIPLVGGSPKLSLPWKEPKTVLTKLRCIVVQDLHAKGYRVTDGTKFGADFLAYPGDPSLFHSQFAVRVMDWHQKISGLCILSAARVALSARKRLVIASVKSTEDDESEEPASPSVSSGVREGSLQSFELKVIYTTIATDLNFVPFEARTQLPDRAVPSRERRGNSTKLEPDLKDDKLCNN